MVILVTHKNPHLDEMAGACLVADTDEIDGWEFWGTGGRTPDGRPAAQHEAEGKMLIGIGGSQTDEHTPGEASQVCAATLVARTRGIDDPFLERMLRYLDRIDSRGGADTFCISEIIKAWHAMHGSKVDHDEEVAFIEGVIFPVLRAMREIDNFDRFEVQDLGRLSTWVEKRGKGVSGAAGLLTHLGVVRHLMESFVARRRRQSRRQDPMGLAVVMTALRKSGMDDDERDRIENELFSAVYDRQERFLNARNVELHRKTRITFSDIVP